MDMVRGGDDDSGRTSMTTRVLVLCHNMEMVMGTSQCGSSIKEVPW
jgi:hypothetical protein